MGPVHSCSANRVITCGPTGRFALYLLVVSIPIFLLSPASHLYQLSSAQGIIADIAIPFFNFYPFQIYMLGTWSEKMFATLMSSMG
ncbi:hypothetical protein I3760_03G170900 [Carya illinoinensis]|nr:hypothetical protein I3760_03G170900 [Carya illinoinensis]